MSRRHRAEKRDVIPDAKFGDVVLSKFMNSVMIDGKKVPKGDLRVGHPITVIDKDLVVWLEYESESNTEFAIESAE